MGLLRKVRGLVGHRDTPDPTAEERAPGMPDTVRAGEVPIKSPPMQIDGRVMTAAEFVQYIEGLEMPAPLPTRFFLHHTWRPTRESWRGFSTILAMKRFYERRLWRDSKGRLREGWTAGPHLFVADDGIWLFSDIRYDGVGVFGNNHRSRHLEMVGNYNDELPSGATLRNTVVALGVLHEKLGLDIRNLNFHRDFSSKSCPGWAVHKDWIIPQVERWIQEYRAARQPKPSPETELAALRTALKRMVEGLLVTPEVESSLTQASAQRGHIGALTQQVPIEVEGQGYLVQFFAEALMAPVQHQDQTLSLGEFELARRAETPEGQPVSRTEEHVAEPEAGMEEQVMDETERPPWERPLAAPPADPYQFTGRIR